MKSFGVWFYLLAKALVVIGALNWGAIAINPDYDITKNFSPEIRKIILITIGLSAIYVSLQLKTYLPFLGECAIPVFKFLKESQVNKELLNSPNSDVKTITINIPNDEVGSKIIYWAANPSDQVINDPKQAYGDFDNSGVASIQNNKAVIYVKCPANYTAMNNLLPKHIHYRIVSEDGMLSRVYTEKNDISSLCN